MTFDIDLPLKIVSELRGVRHAFYMEQDLMDQVLAEESTVVGSGGISVDNQGFKQALTRQHVICIVKDARFRPPPAPTVVLTTEDGKIMGEEVFPHTAVNYKDREDIMWMSDGFVVFPNEINATGGEKFVMPPIAFEELNETNGCKNVISCSPAPTCDLIIKTAHGIADDPKIASILVAFDELD